MDSVQIVRLLASHERRKVAAVLMLSDEPVLIADLAATSGLASRQVVDALDRLVTAGLVEQVDDAYLLDHDVFQQAARAEAPSPAASEHADQPEDVAKVLDVAFKGGKLVQWPSKHAKRLVVLDYLAQQFEIGTRYPEQLVNDMLREFNDDVATSRRYLVDEQFLDRGEGMYWRCGGSI